RPVLCITHNSRCRFRIPKGFQHSAQGCEERALHAPARTARQPFVAPATKGCNARFMVARRDSGIVGALHELERRGRANPGLTDAIPWGLAETPQGLMGKTKDLSPLWAGDLAAKRARPSCCSSLSPWNGRVRQANASR